MPDENITSDNLVNHLTARFSNYNGVKGETTADIARWQKLCERAHKSDAVFDTCPVCDKNFDKSEFPYTGQFIIYGKITSKILCKDCAYTLSRHVIESDGSLHNGKCKYPKVKRTVKNSG